MMFWFNHGISGWGWFGMSLGMIVFWGLIITGAVLLFRSLDRTGEHTRTHTPAVPSAEQILAERFARGEIDEEEYQRRLTALRTADRLTKH
jgi:putative membrane protein